MSTDQLEAALDKSLLREIRTEVQNRPEVIKRQQEVDQEIDAINAERLWTRFFFRHPEIKDITANRKFIFDYALSLSSDDVVRYEHLDEAAKLPGLARQRVNQPLTAANLKQDEEILRQFCRANQLEPNSAALNLLRTEYGAGFDSAQIGNALQSGLIQLGPASAKILQEAAQQRQEYLLQATPGELRHVARQETEQRRNEAQQQEADRHLQAAIARDASYGFPPLPATWGGQPLDAAFIKNCPAAVQKLISGRFGSAALDKRLRGLG
jgi:hypothetical protein